MKTLKCILCYIIKHVAKKMIIEVHLSEDVPRNFSFIQRILCNGYNLVSNFLLK